MNDSMLAFDGENYWEVTNIEGVLGVLKRNRSFRKELITTMKNISETIVALRGLAEKGYVRTRGDPSDDDALLRFAVILKENFPHDWNISKP